MTDALLVRGLERLEDLSGGLKRLVDGQWAMMEAIGKRVAFDELEYQVSDDFGLSRRGRGFRQIVDSGDVGMVESSNRLRLAMKPRDSFRITRVRLGQDLDRDLAIQPGVAG